MTQLLVVARERMPVEERAITLEELHAAEKVDGRVRAPRPPVAGACAYGPRTPEDR
jgi:hypothetical protein